MKFPSRKQIEKAMAILEKAESTKLLSDDASLIEKVKFSLCRQFVVYHQEKGLTQKELAKKLDIDPAQMSKILHYHIDEFSFDFLLELVLKIYPKTNVKIDVA